MLNCVVFVWKITEWSVNHRQFFIYISFLNLVEMKDAPMTMATLLLFLFGFIFFLFLLFCLFCRLIHFHSLFYYCGNFGGLYQPVFIIIDLRLFGLLFRNVSATTRRWQWLFSLWTFWRAQRLLWWLFGKHLWQKPALLWFWFVSNRLLLLWHLCHNWLIRWKILRLDNTHSSHW